MHLEVTGANANGRLAPRYAFDGGDCGGQNLRPTLHWHGQPKATRSLAIGVFDPDAPTGHGWWHWFVLDLPATTSGLEQDAALPPPAFALRNDYGQRGWGGPCPPPGPAHRYVFTVYALDQAHLALAPDTSPANALRAVQAHTLDSAQVTLTYGRERP
ncbi:YbhB/YbcL family Raf kinase inhibitor-like protein [Oleiagrimonas sp. C23AA]|nr:YbhB/YbcL family Raf kinase inhibitor-like protein [Oleiagrimonas sp. C23AA]